MSKRLNITKKQYIEAHKIATKLSNMFFYARIKRICDLAVDEFYRGYHPFTYRRTNDLKNAYFIDIVNDKFIFILGSRYMKHSHRVDRGKYPNQDYIFETVFINGWHGGATSGEGHPEGDDAYWRTPSPKYAQKTGTKPYVYWYSRPAVKSEKSIYQVIKEEKDSLVDYYESKMKNEFLIKAYKQVGKR